MSKFFTFQLGGIGRQMKGVKSLRIFAVPVVLFSKTGGK